LKRRRLRDYLYHLAVHGGPFFKFDMEENKKARDRFTEMVRAADGRFLNIDMQNGRCAGLATILAPGVGGARPLTVKEAMGALLDMVIALPVCERSYARPFSQSKELGPAHSGCAARVGALC
jgi:hypothetical protein